MEALQGWRSSEGELALATATAELRKCCWRCETAKGTEAKQMEARNGSGGRWHEEGALGHGVACADRALATRGRRWGHAARGF